MKARRGVLGGAALCRQVDDFLAFVRRDVRAETFFRRMYASADTPERKKVWLDLWRQYCNKYRKEVSA